ncbi:MAG: hypothetical protein OXH15_09975 [Gammaproteobacteria bacterium]|nr:hypothetical protein [Gammaproteobacteria bacterium]
MNRRNPVHASRTGSDMLELVHTAIVVGTAIAAIIGLLQLFNVV